MFDIRVMTIEDYDEVMRLMRGTPGVSFRDADSPDATRRYLERNPHLSFVAEMQGRVNGCVMSGHDGRRGYLQHLVVREEVRGTGMGTALVKRCLSALAEVGIQKVHIDVFKTNDLANAYWERQGWKLRTDTNRYSIILGGGDNA